MKTRSLRRPIVPAANRRPVPGLKTCQTCGHVYTNTAMLCPNCHPVGGIRKICPTLIMSTQPEYPVWLSAFSKECKLTDHQLLTIFCTATPAPQPISKQAAKALWYCRINTAIPADVDLGAVEAEYRKQVAQ